MDYYKLGQSIRRARRDKGLSQEELAEQVNISTTHMSHIETGSTKLSLQVFVDIAVALDIPTDDLLQDQRGDTDTLSALRVTRLLDGCSPKEGKIIEDVITALKGSFDRYL